MQPAGPRSEWGRGLAAGFGGDNACIVPRALRCRRPQAAGENARPTLRPETGDNAEEAAPRQARRRADASIGPYAALRADRGMRRPAAPGSAACLPCIVGRAFTPAGGLAAARKGIGKARRRTPQSADADSSPYRGAFRVAVPPKPPLQGEVDAPQGADGGVHCRFAPQVSCNPRQGFALCFAGTISALRAGTSRFALRNAACGRQCLHRPGNPAMPQTPGGGRNRPPCIAAGSRRRQIRASLPPGPPTGR